jgi:poly(ADP-ribose) glycohydrolase
MRRIYFFEDIYSCIYVCRDNWGRKWCHLVAIDAIYYRDPTIQYQMKYIKRELSKAYIGFYSHGQSQSTSFPIATGNWGCGAFNGDRQLKGRHLF